MLLFIRAQPQGITAKEAASALSIPVSVARWRLEKLAGAGLVHAAFERRARGRPAKLYSAAPEAAQIEFPARGYERLVSLLLRHRNRRKVGAEFSRQLAESIGLRAGSGLEALCHALGKAGFQASVSPDRKAILSTTCPLRPIVVADPDAREIDQGMWSALVGTATGAVGAKCSTHDCLDPRATCRIEVAFTSRTPSS